MLRKIAQIFARLIGGALSLVIVCYLTLLVINWQDIPPSQEATRFSQIYANRPHVADEQNAYVYLVGMSVEPGYEPMKAGLAMINVARSESTVSEFIDYKHPDYPQIDFPKGRSELVAELVKACRSVSDECLTHLDGGVDSNVRFNSIDQILLDRYNVIIKLSAWQDRFPQGLLGPFPSYNPVLDGQTISLFEIWLHAKSRGAIRTIALLDSDASFWRMLFASSDSLVTSMIAGHALKKNQFWTNLVLRSLRTTDHDVPSTWLVPFSNDERLMMRAWAGEMALAEHLVREIPAPEKFRIMLGYERSFTPSRIDSWLAKPLFQPQETLNRNAKLRASLVDMFNVPYENLPLIYANLEGEPLRYDEGEMSFPRVMFNPVGKSLDMVGFQNEAGYMFRVPNLEGGRRALLATLELRYNKTPRDNVMEALAGSAYRNPYTNEPFIWDEATGSVVFEGLSEGKGRRYSFVY